MFAFKFKVVIICIRCKPDFFYFAGLCLCFKFFFFFLFVVQKFIVINDLTNRRICRWRYFYKVERLLLRHFQCFLRGINSYFYIISYKAHLRNSYHMVGAVFLLLFFSKTW